MRFQIFLEKMVKGIVATNRTIPILRELELFILFSIFGFVHLSFETVWKGDSSNTLLCCDDDDDLFIMINSCFGVQYYWLKVKRYLVSNNIEIARNMHDRNKLHGLHQHMSGLHNKSIAATAVLGCLLLFASIRLINK